MNKRNIIDIKKANRANRPNKAIKNLGTRDNLYKKTENRGIKYNPCIVVKHSSIKNNS